ncbi:hypothetical protein LJD47_33440, partial [Escherichia coli]|nr:hypothetical protein [Escherichia coli]
DTASKADMQFLPLSPATLRCREKHPDSPWPLVKTAAMPSLRLSLPIFHLNCYQPHTGAATRDVAARPLFS